MEHTGSTTEVPNYCYQIGDAGKLYLLGPSFLQDPWPLRRAGPCLEKIASALGKQSTGDPRTPPMLKQNVREMN